MITVTNARLNGLISSVGLMGIPSAHVYGQLIIKSETASVPQTAPCYELVVDGATFRPHRACALVLRKQDDVTRFSGCAFSRQIPSHDSM